MSCRRAFDLDLAAFLLEPREAQWDDFRAHYPLCRECAAEVAAWTALEASLAPAHPDEETLLRWAHDAHALDPATRASLARHVAGCASCSDELRALGRFDAILAAAREDAAEAPAAQVARASGAATTPVAPPVAEEAAARHEGRRHEAAARPAGRRVDHGATRAATATSHGRGTPRRGALATLRRLVWHPALPYAALFVLLLLPAFRDRFEQTGGPPLPPMLDAVRQKTSAPAVAPQQAPAAAPPASEQAPGTQLADADGSFAKERRRDRPAARPPEQPQAPQAARQEGPEPPPAPVPARPQAAAQDAELEAARDHAREADAVGAAGSSERAQPQTLAAARAASADRDEASFRLTAPDGAGRRTLFVELAVPAGGGTVEVRVRDASGARELRERVEVAAQARSLRLDVPAAWLASKRLEVEVVAADGSVVASGSATTP